MGQSNNRYVKKSRLPILERCFKLWCAHPGDLGPYGTMFGMSANFNTPEVQSNWLRSQRYERLAERNDRMDIISRTR